MAEPWFKFYPTDWRSDPRLRMCGIAARGLWIEMIALMHEASPYGHLLVSGQSPTDTQLAVLAGMPSDQIPALLGELESAGVFSRTREGVIYSRKLTRMAKKAAIARRNGKNGGNPTLSNQTGNAASDNQEVKGADKPQKPDARSQEEIEPRAQQSVSAKAAPRKHEELSNALLEANGLGTGFRDERNPGLVNLAHILGMLDAGYDLELDILAAIRAKPNPQARTWGYFDGQIRDYREKRLGVASRKAPPDPSSATSSWPLEKWRPLIQHWHDTGNWNREALGPAPNEQGTRAPPELLKAA